MNNPRQSIEGAGGSAEPIEGEKESEISQLIERARSGNKKAAEALLMRYYYHLEVGEAIPKPLLWYFAFAFVEILRGSSADDALNVRRGKGRPSEKWGDASLKQSLLGIRVADLRREGATHEEAVESVAETSAASESSVKRGFTECREQVRYIVITEGADVLKYSAMVTKLAVKAIEHGIGTGRIDAKEIAPGSVVPYGDDLNTIRLQAEVSEGLWRNFDLFWGR